MTRRYFGILAAAVLLISAVAAQEQQSADESGGRSRGRSRGSGNGGGFEQMREQIRKANEQIKEKFPEEYKELEKLEATDRRAAFQKRLELAKKAGIELPEFGGRRGGDRRPDAAEQDMREEWRKAEEAVKEKLPAEFAEFEKLRETNPDAALAKLRELAEKAEVKLPEGQPSFKNVGPRNVARLAVEYADRVLQQRYPDEYAQIVELRAEDPDLAREQYRELFKRAGLNAEEIKKRVVARSASTRVVQVEVPQTPSSTGGNTGNTNRRWGGMGGMGGPGGPGGNW